MDGLWMVYGWFMDGLWMVYRFMLVDAVDEKIGGYLVTWLIDSNPHMKYLINAPRQLPAVYFFYSFGSPVQGIVWY